MLRAMNTQTQVVGGPRAWWTAWLAFWRRRILPALGIGGLILVWWAVIVLFDVKPFIAPSKQSAPKLSSTCTTATRSSVT